MYAEKTRRLCSTEHLIAQTDQGRKCTRTSKDCICYTYNDETVCAWQYVKDLAFGRERILETLPLGIRGYR